MKPAAAQQRAKPHTVHPIARPANIACMQSTISRLCWASEQPPEGGHTAPQAPANQIQYVRGLGWKSRGRRSGHTDEQAACRAQTLRPQRRPTVHGATTARIPTALHRRCQTCRRCSLRAPTRHVPITEAGTEDHIRAAPPWAARPALARHRTERDLEGRRPARNRRDGSPVGLANRHGLQYWHYAVDATRRGTEQRASGTARGTGTALRARRRGR